MITALLLAAIGFACSLVITVFLGIWMLPRIENLGRSAERSAVTVTTGLIVLSASAVGFACDGLIGILGSLLGAAPLLVSGALDLRRLSRPETQG
jgi:hypothetical protein